MSAGPWQACGLPHAPKAVGTTAQLWLNLPTDYNSQIARRYLGKTLDRIKTVNKPKTASEEPPAYGIKDRDSLHRDSIGFIS